jgi:c-di-GMP-binding flagellar brake protein YcgR
MELDPAQDQPPEKREHFRISVVLPLHYRLTGEPAGEPSPAEVNISGGGIGFVTTRQFNPDDSLDLRLVLPDTQSIHAAAKVVRIAPIARDKSSHLVGARFTAIGDEDRERLISFIFRLQAERRRSHFDV